MMGIDLISNRNNWFSYGVAGAKERPESAVRPREGRFWRGRVKLPGRLNTLFESEYLAPQFMVKISEKYHVIVQSGHPEYLVFVENFPKTRPEDIYVFHLTGIEVCDLAVYGQDMFILDSKGQAVHHIPDITVRLDSGMDADSLYREDFIRIEIKNIVVNKNTRFALLSTPGSKGYTHYLFWQLDTNFVMEGRSVKRNINLLDTCLGMDRKLFSAIKLSHVVIDTDRLLITCGDSSRIIRVELKGAKFIAKNLIGDGVNQLQISGKKPLRIPCPKGILIYRFGQGAQAMENLKEFYPDHYIELYNNRFGVVVDYQEGVALQFLVDNSVTSISPLIGLYPTENSSNFNLLTIDISDFSLLVAGMRGELVFWSAGRSLLGVLDPNIAELADTIRKNNKHLAGPKFSEVNRNC